MTIHLTLSRTPKFSQKNSNPTKPCLLLDFVPNSLWARPGRDFETFSLRHMYLYLYLSLVERKRLNSIIVGIKITICFGLIKSISWLLGENFRCPLGPSISNKFWPIWSRNIDHKSCHVWCRSSLRLNMIHKVDSLALTTLSSGQKRNVFRGENSTTTLYLLQMNLAIWSYPCFVMKSMFLKAVTLETMIAELADLI